jgi:hypothetical protein
LLGLLLPALAWGQAGADGGQPAAPPAGVLAASAVVDRQEVRLGEAFRLTIQVRDPAGRRYALQPEQRLEPFVELGREERVESLGGQRVQLIELKLAVYDQLGALEVPGLRLTPSGEDGGGGEPLELPPVPIRVLSMLEGLDQPEPRDVAPPVPVRVPDYRLLAWGGLLLLLAALTLALSRLRTGAPSASPLEELPPPRLAHEIALEKLQAVVAADLLRQGRHHEFFVRVSEAVREYLGNRYGFFALDRTTRELVEEFRDRITPGLRLGDLTGLLEQADRVKFARHLPADADCSEAINTAFSLVEDTRVRAEQDGSAEASP